MVAIRKRLDDGVPKRIDFSEVYGQAMDLLRYRDSRFHSHFSLHVPEMIAQGLREMLRL